MIESPMSFNKNVNHDTDTYHAAINYQTQYLIRKIGLGGRIGKLEEKMVSLKLSRS